MLQALVHSLAFLRCGVEAVNRLSARTELDSFGKRVAFVFQRSKRCSESKHVDRAEEEEKGWSRGQKSVRRVVLRSDSPKEGCNLHFCFQ